MSGAEGSRRVRGARVAKKGDVPCRRRTRAGRARAKGARRSSEGAWSGTTTKAAATKAAAAEEAGWQWRKGTHEIMTEAGARAS